MAWMLASSNAWSSLFKRSEKASASSIPKTYLQKHYPRENEYFKEFVEDFFLKSLEQSCNAAKKEKKYEYDHFENEDGAIVRDERVHAEKSIHVFFLIFGDKFFIGSNLFTI